MNSNQPQLDLSVVVPCFNDGPHIKAMCGRIRQALDDQGLSWELILVNDGSDDNTWDAIREAQEKAPQTIRGIDLGRNQGQHPAICAGFSIARGRFVATCDSDLPVAPKHLLTLLTSGRDSGADVTVGIRSGRSVSASRSRGSILFNWLYRRTLNSTLRDTGSMFRLYTRRAVNILLNSETRKQYLPAATAWAGLRVGEVEVPATGNVLERSSHYGLWRLVRMALDFYFEYTELPLKLATGVGSAMMALGLAGFLALLVYRITIGPGVSGLAFVISAVFLLIGLQFLMLGIVAYYAFRIFSRPREPGFWIAEIVEDRTRLDDASAAETTPGPPHADGTVR